MEEIDLMPHAWILERLELYKIKSTIRTFIKDWKGMWRTTREAISKPVAQVIIQCSTYKGDTLFQSYQHLCLPVIRYPAGITTWLKEKMEAIHIKTRKLLTRQEGFHPKVQHPEAEHKLERLIMSIWAAIQDETTKIQKYIKDKYKMASSDELLSYVPDSRNPKVRRGKSKHHGWTSPYMHVACTTEVEQKRWLISKGPTVDWKRLDWKTAQKH